MTETAINRSSTLFGVAAIIVALSVAYHYVIYIPAQDKQAKEDQQSAQLSYNLCVAAADSSFLEEWNSYCQANPAWQGKDSKCDTLPIRWIDDIKSGIEKKKAQCLAELKSGVTNNY